MDSILKSFNKLSNLSLVAATAVVNNRGSLKSSQTEKETK